MLSRKQSPHVHGIQCYPIVPDSRELCLLLPDRLCEVQRVLACQSNFLVMSVNETDVAEVASDNISSTENSEQKNEYGYLERNLFSSEAFKIELRNLPKFFGIAEMKKLLTHKLKLKLRKVKAVSRMGSNKWVYLCFENQEEQNKALKVLDNYKWKGRLLQAREAQPAPDPLVKRKNAEMRDGNDAKKAKLESQEDLLNAVRKSATPLFDIPYDAQLIKKTKDAEALLSKFGYDILKANPNCVDRINQLKESNNGLPCKLYPCEGIESKSDGYRNKCEFTIGLNGLTREITVGFRLGTYASGSTEVAPIAGLKNVPSKMCEAVGIFEDYVKISKLDSFCPESLQGQWGQLTVRMGTNTGELMLIAGIHDMNITPEELNRVKQEMIQYFTTGDGSKLGVTSLYLQKLVRKQSGKETPSPELLMGAPHIEEELSGIKFKISPNSFFQINTLCAELMVKKIKELAGVTKETTLLDVCCGIGTLGLCLAKDCGQVLGLERDQQAVNDAKENATRNSVANAEFYCGSADAIMHSVICHARYDDIVAILDPPRAGLHNRAIQLIRKTEKIKKIIYLSCDARLAYRNFCDLCKAESKTMSGPPFHLISVLPVDMFPHTDRYELVLYFERENVDVVNT